MFNLDLTKEDYQFLYKVFIDATLKDDYDFTCKYCKMSKKGNCGSHYCEVLKYKLYKLIESL